MNDFLIVILALVPIALIGWIVMTYNRLISEREFVRNSMSQIAAQIESRWDALKTIIDATKDYGVHESKVFSNITEQRSALTPQSKVADVEKDSGLFNQAMTNLFAVAEAYPDLKAAGVYQSSIEKIDGYEQQVRQSRMIYNDTVTRFNRSVQSVPTNIIAGIFNFEKESYFTQTECKTEMPLWKA